MCTYVSLARSSLSFSLSLFFPFRVEKRNERKSLSDERERIRAEPFLILLPFFLSLPPQIHPIHLPPSLLLRNPKPPLRSHPPQRPSPLPLLRSPPFFPPPLLNQHPLPPRFSLLPLLFRNVVVEDLGGSGCGDCALWRGVVWRGELLWVVGRVGEGWGVAEGIWEEMGEDGGGVG